MNQEELKKLLHYEPSSGEFTWLVNRGGGARAGNKAGWNDVDHNLNHLMYRKITVNGKTYKAHRLAFLYMTGNFPKYDVDHEDGCGLNNKWCNLSDVTSAENAKNRKLGKNNTTGTIGITWCTSKCKYIARIQLNGKNETLGTFNDIEHAKEARKEAELRYNFHPNHGKR